MDSSDVSLLYSEVCKGNIAPTIFANWWDIYTNYDELGTKSIWMYFPGSKDTSLIMFYQKYRHRGELFFAYDKYTIQTQKKIDQKRSEFNLEPFETVKEKIKFIVNETPIYYFSVPNIQLDVKMTRNHKE